MDKHRLIPIILSTLFQFLNINLVATHSPSDLLDVISFDPEDIRFLSFSTAPFNESEYKEIRLEDAESLKKAGLVPGQTVHIITHGFTDDIANGPCAIVASAFLDTNTKNVICVDWSKLAGPNETIVSSILGYASYFPIVARNVRITGHRVANFTEFLIDNGIGTYDSIELLGHSLGAHVSGIAGRKIKQDRGQSIGRIVGFDPAGPLYQGIPSSRKLSKNDALEVESIHTDALLYGTTKSDGSINWWVNGGRGQDQPSCPSVIDQFMGCSHRASVEYYARAIRGEKFYGCPCRKTTLMALVSLCPQPSKCANQTLFGPFAATQRGTGNHYVTII